MGCKLSAKRQTTSMASIAWKPRLAAQAPHAQVQQTSQTPAQVPDGMDPALYQRYMEFLHHASAAQFKPCKLYVIFTDPTSFNCAQMVRGNNDLDKQVEIIDAAQVQNRPSWLKGVPSLMDDKGQFYLGSECVMWIRYQANQSLAGLNESTGVTQVIDGAPSAVDGAATVARAASTGGMSSFVPEKIVSDRDWMNSIDSGRAAQRFDTYTREEIAPPPNPLMQHRPGGGQYGPNGGGPNGPNMQLPFEQIKVGRGGHSDQMDQMMQQIEQDRQRLLTQKRLPHHQQHAAAGGGAGRMGWNPIQTERVQRPNKLEQMDQQLAQLQQQREQLQVPMRKFQ